ncbi:MAG: cytochrome c oxidase accessory protein CcoG [Planctomycetota bacterium]
MNPLPMAPQKPTTDHMTTIGEGGRRLWLYPSAVKGAWFTRRQVVYAALVILFFALPWLKIGGQQAVLLNIPARKFAFFGFVVWPQDTILFWLVMFTFFIGIFFFTAVLGRIWCGWACPQTVFLEGIFRWIDRRVEGSAAQRRRLDRAPWTAGKVARKVVKHVLFLVVASHIANTVVCYFVGTDDVIKMSLRPPAENLGWFSFMLGMNLLVYFDFAWFREQVCTVVCPYGRWQSVMLDNHSKIVGYDEARGENRGTARQRKTLETATDEGQQASFGDCVDCNRCVTVCPTGIDIRMGLQMECINCTACIDACDDIMRKVGKPEGLIRFTSLAELAGEPAQPVRPRTVIYGIMLAIACIAFVVAVITRRDIEVQVLRGSGRSVQVVGEDAVNHLRAKIINKTDAPIEVRVSAPAPWQLTVPLDPCPVAAGSTATLQLFVRRPSQEIRAGDNTVPLTFTSGGKIIEERDVRVLAW